MKDQRAVKLEPHTVIKPLHKMSNFDTQEKELESQFEELTKKKQEIQQAKQQAKEAERNQLLEQHKKHLEDATGWRQLAKETNNKDMAKNYLDEAMHSQKEANRIASLLGLNTDAIEEKTLYSQVRSLSTSKAILFLVLLFFVSLFVTWYIGKDAMSDPLNPIGQSIMKNGPLRAMVAFSLTFLTTLVAIFFMWLLFNPIFNLWHNRISTERNLESLIAEAPAWSLLGALFALFYLITSLFANYYTTIFA